MTVPAPSIASRPSNLEAEMALLGSILVDKEMMATVARSSSRTTSTPRCTRRSISRSRAVRDAASRSTRSRVAEELRAARHARQGRRPRLSDVVDGYGADGRVGGILRQRSCARSRRCAASFTPARRSRSSATKAKKTSPASLDASEQIVYEVGERAEPQRIHAGRSLLEHGFDNIDRLFQQRGDRTGITSGFRDIDEIRPGSSPAT